MSEKFDSFQPRRATSVDGFLSGAGQQPRNPLFRKPHSTQPQSLRQDIASAPSQGRAVGLPDVSKRPTSLQQVSEAQVMPERKMYANQDQPSATMQSAVEQPLSRRAQRKADKLARKAEKRAAKRERRAKGRGRRIAKFIGLLLLLAVLAMGARFYKDIASLTGNKNPLSLLGVFRPANLANDNGRVNILVAGNSADDLGHDGGELTDSIMVLSLNTKNDSALMLSVPRDLWVEKSDGSHGKINSVYPEDGMEGLQSVIENVTGLPIHYNALVNYTAFKDLVDAVGGISITIASDDPRGIYDPSLDYTSRNCCALAKYQNGPVTLNGKQALNLARARGDAYGSYGYPDADYTRTKHQRQMLIAIKDKAVSPSVIANPLKIGSLVDAVGSNVKTDLQVNELQALFYYAKRITDGKIDSYNINNLKGDKAYMLAGDMIDGQSVQAPAAGIDDFNDIQAQIKKVFTAGPLVKENAAIMILNGTDAVGLAKQQKNKLFDQGADILGTADALSNQPNTTVIDNSEGKKPNTLAYLKKTYNATVVTNTTLTANYPAADFILILGQNAVPNLDNGSNTSGTNN